MFYPLTTGFKEFNCFNLFFGSRLIAFKNVGCTKDCPQGIVYFMAERSNQRTDGITNGCIKLGLRQFFLNSVSNLMGVDFPSSDPSISTRHLPKEPL